MSKTTIGEVCKVIKGSTGITKAVPGKYPLVTTSAERLSHNKFQFDCEAVCVPLVSSTGHGHASMHRLHHQNGNFALGSILAAIIPKDERVVDTKFLYIYLSLMKDRVFVPLMKGTANISLSVKAIKSAKIELPTIDRQRKIAKLCDRATPLLHSLGKVFEAQKHLASDLRDTILREAVRGKLIPQAPNDEPASVLLEKIKIEKQRLVKEGKIKKQKRMPPIKPDETYHDPPHGWEWTRLGDIIDFVNGYAFKSSDYQETGIGIIRIGNIKNGEITTDGMKFIAPPIQDSFNDRLKVCPDDLVIAMSGATTGKLGFNKTKEVFLLNQRVGKLTLFLVNPFYAFFYLTTKVQENLSISAGSAIPNLSTAQIRSTVFPLPPLSEQQRIVAKVDKLMKLCDELEEKLNQAKADSDKLMASVVHHLLSRSPRRVRVTTPYKDDAAVVCFLLAEMEKLHRPTTEFFIQKHIFAAKHHLHLPVNSVFKRKVAGPWSQELKRKAIHAAIKTNWLNWDKQGNLVRGPSFNKGLNHAATILGEHATQLAQLVKNLKGFGNNGLERWTTVLKVVEDLKETQQPITRSSIQREINNWPGKSLKKIFAEESVDHTIAMMLKHNWLSPLDKS